MIYNFPQYEKLRRKIGITSNQLYFCMLLLIKSHKEKLEIYNNYVEKHGGFDYSDIKELINKGYLEDFCDSKVLKTIIDENRKVVKVKDVALVEMYLVTPKFKEGVLVDDNEAAKEAWDAYPKVLKINNKMQSAKNMGYEEFEIAYGKIINGNGILHKRIVDMFTSYKGLIKKDKAYGMGIKGALEKKLWEIIEEMIELDNDNKDMLSTI